MNAFHRLTVPSLITLCFAGRAQAQTPPSRAGAVPTAAVALSPDTLPVNQNTHDRAALYEREAILIEPHSLGARVLQGQDRRVLAELNDFRNTRLAEILARSPKAADEARVYDANHRAGAFLLLAGIAGIAAGGVASQLGDGGGSFPLWLGGTLLMSAGSVKMNRAIHALPRAVWWYNHDLVAGK